MVNNKRLLISLFLIFALLITACSSSKTGTSSPATSAPAGTSAAGNATAQPAVSVNPNNTQGVTDTEIVLGVTAPLSGPVAAYATSYFGQDAYWKYVNGNGGINGRKIRLVVYDDQYQPAKTVEAAKRLVEQDKIFAIVGPPCTSCFSAANPVYDANKMLVYAMTPATKFLVPTKREWFASGVNYMVEANAMLHYAVEKLNAKKIGIFYQNDDFGKDGANATVEAIEKKFKSAGVTSVMIPYNATDVEFSTQALKIRAEKPDVVLAYAVPKPAASLRAEMHKLGVNPPYIVSFVVGNTNVTRDLAGQEAWTGTISSNYIPTINETDNPKIKLFWEQFKKFYPKETPNELTTIAWNNAVVVGEVLKQLGKDVTRDNFIKTIESFTDYKDILNYELKYTPDNHFGATKMLFNQEQADGTTKSLMFANVDPRTLQVTFSEK